jgi:two-component system, response regulator YesN
MYDILIVDIDPIFREGLKVAIELDGYIVKTASDGNDALRLLNEFKPKLIITDILMEDSNGRNIIITQKKVNPDIKILAISGSRILCPDNYLKSAIVLGANSCLLKPFSKEEIMYEIHNILEAN